MPRPLHRAGIFRARRPGRAGGKSARSGATGGAQTAGVSDWGLVSGFWNLGLTGEFSFGTKPASGSESSDRETHPMPSATGTEAYPESRDLTPKTLLLTTGWAGSRCGKTGTPPNELCGGRIWGRLAFPYRMTIANTSGDTSREMNGAKWKAGRLDMNALVIDIG